MQQFILLAAEATFGGMTVADIVSLLGLLAAIWGGVVWVLDKKLVEPLREMIQRLDDHMQQADKRSEQRDHDYERITGKLQEHDRQFIRDESKISELFEELKHKKEE